MPGYILEGTREVSCALGGRADERRSFDLIEIRLVEILADGSDELVAQLNPVLHSLRSEVEESVLEPQVLTCAVLVFNHEGEYGTLAQYLDIRCLYFDFAGFHIGIDHLGGSLSYDALYRYAVLELEKGCRFLKRAMRHHPRQPASVRSGRGG